ncbi:putative adenylyltransferase/sulfurtransferase MoeZ [bacterium BMS3Abin05]|nr:putative adenylyltransferase/sulfurtransferase MoeZ [bacterium BMS3Abin05]GBE28676.1 putative adenylyltransferase/sulfurtransferase MoeZ [bacterium BMS3Bbin03]HDK35915.1 molybdopterin-synthase adenylyltransferase MoeB [Bacteroidota bacterium]HDL78760.1 molybdopterin-synthase adenylyltransferase MoeB [Bacteroidota bacterium]HDZ11681.1 molybdopterin-synthase adenylyltransferase MoeB [Bacteroidota bacterium]
MAIRKESFDNWAARYDRHIRLDEIGEAGQICLNESKVLVIGTGGLGSPVALYLAAAGVGTIGLVDHDRVDLSNLQRQVLHSTQDIGRPKVDSAAEKLQKLNPDLMIQKYKDYLNKENALEIISKYDIVVDGSDNFPTRFLLNDACYMLKKPLVFGAVLEFQGQVTIFTQEEDSACYRCLFPEAPDPALAPTCAQAGVLGVLTGIIGSVQASEAIKSILKIEEKGFGRHLKNRIWNFNALTSTAEVLPIHKDPDCPLCSREKVSLDEFNYDHFCEYSV